MMQTSPTQPPIPFPAKKAGLTLVEALLVLAVLTLIAAISFPAWSQNRAKQRSAHCGMQLDAIAIACRAYLEAEDTFPPTLSALVPEFLPNVPQCPSGGTYTLGTAEGNPPACSIPGHRL